MRDLPFREVWAVDFEFVSEPGDRPVPVCMVARELRSGRLIRMWQDELPSAPPFPVDSDCLFVAYMAAAELGCFLQLGWPMPARILDLYVEFRARGNGARPPLGWGLLSALSVHGLPSIGKDEKESWRALVLRGGPWTRAERAGILDYCQEDVDVLGPLLERMLPGIWPEPVRLRQALLRGRYMAAVARMESAGISVDTATLAELRAHWPDLKADLIGEVDRDFGVYEGTVFKLDKFAKWLACQGIAWPRLDSGQLKSDDDTFKDMAKLHLQVAPLRELRHSLSDLRLEQLAVGADGRNRAGLMPFGTRTGRNAPSSTKFVFGTSVWLRGLVKPGPGRAVAYIDWHAQEVAIAAALSGDAALLAAVQSGDPYLAFARLAGLAPADATKESHGRVREMCKQCVLGANYGMQADNLAYRIGGTKGDAERLLRALARAFPVYRQWSEDTVDRGQLTGRLESVYGWPLRIGASTRPTQLLNYPMQSNGAEMLRIACCLATERGVQVCAPVHDAILIEAPADGIEAAVAETQRAMGDASRAVLNGLEIGSAVEVVSWPGRYADKRGASMWDKVNGLLRGYAKGPQGAMGPQGATG